MRRCGVDKGGHDLKRLEGVVKIAFKLVRKRKERC